MKEITHRQMRNESGDVLRRVADGESLLVTNNGQPAAVINPPGGDTLTILESQGSVRPALDAVQSLRSIQRRKSKKPTAEILSDIRGPR